MRTNRSAASSRVTPPARRHKSAAPATRWSISALAALHGIVPPLLSKRDSPGKALSRMAGSAARDEPEAPNALDKLPRNTAAEDTCSSTPSMLERLAWVEAQSASQDVKRTTATEWATEFRSVVVAHSSGARQPDPRCSTHALRPPSKPNSSGTPSRSGLVGGNARCVD
jgi:hypothetical protein